jgi:hypothetical protein
MMSRCPQKLEPEQDHPKNKFWKNLDPLLGQAFRRTQLLDQLSDFPHPPQNSAYCTRDNRFVVRTRREIHVVVAFRTYKMISEYPTDASMNRSNERS